MDHQQVLKNEIKQYLVSKNCEKTYYHCMEVGEYAYQLGEKYLTSPEKVSIAGYLHDISAVYPNNQRISAVSYTHLDVYKRQVLTRLLAIVPVIICVIIYGGSETAVEDLLLYTQVFLSIALPVSIIPLTMYTSDKKLMEMCIRDS